MKRKLINNALFFVLCFLLASCFSPWTDNGMGTFTITVGVAPGRNTLIRDGAINVSDLLHTIAIFDTTPWTSGSGSGGWWDNDRWHPPSQEITEAPEPVFFQEGIAGGSRIGFSLPPGNYYFVVDAFYNNEPVAHGYTNRDIRAGNNGLIQIVMVE